MTTLDEIILAAWLWVEQLAEAGQETADQSGTSSPVSKNNILDILSVADPDTSWSVFSNFEDLNPYSEYGSTLEKL